MNPLDPILLTIYLLSVFIFLMQIKSSFNDEFVIKPDDAWITHQLEKFDLKDKVKISFGFDKRYEYNKINQFGIDVKNLTEDSSVYIDWDWSIITNWREVGTDGGLSARRMTRLNPGTTIDLSQEQVFSTVAPKTTFSTKVTAEDCLQRKDTPELEFKIVKPLLEFKKGKQLSEFQAQVIEFEFFAELALRFAGLESTHSGTRFNILCRFVMTHLPWTAGLPWNPK
ncbi:MAG TPA: hypothetical protein IGS53_20125 [Leptolyngbyaceae cyanobacterium M33_DOE_097]|nr:hypothetical protein [Leptolyngbyaceae cyanobacterium M33_DOE_097]